MRALRLDGVLGSCTTGVAGALTLEQPPTYFVLWATAATRVMGGLNSTLRLGHGPLAPGILLGDGEAEP